MGLVFNRGRPMPPAQQRDGLFGISSAADLIPRRSGGSGSAMPYVNDQQALTISAVWAAVAIRADLVATLPLSAYIQNPLDSGQSRLDAQLSPFMSNPDFMEFLYSSQSELDLTGNSIGIINAKGSNGVAAEIELVPSSQVSVVIKKGKVADYRIGTDEYDPANIWHEKQYTRSGLHVGMSPVAHSAYQSGLYKTVQDFAMQWFLSGNGPRASLANTEKKLSPKEAAIVKESWRASQSMGEPFVHGSDWTYSLVQAQEASADWLDSQKFSLADIARFFRIPADLLDAAVNGGNVTYANVLQRNLQFLIIHLGPAITRRENALSQLLPGGRSACLDADYLMRMDPLTLSQVVLNKIDARAITPNEARAIDNRKPMTPDQMKEFELTGLNKTATAALTGADDLPAPTVTSTGAPATQEPPANV